MIALVLSAVEENKVNPGLLGFTVVAVLGVATWFLIKSMMRHLRRVNVPEGDRSKDSPPQA